MLVRGSRSTKDDESGFSLVEIVIAMALFAVIGSVFVFAIKAIVNVQGTSNQKATSVISQSGISNIFRNDVSNSKAVNLVNGSYLQLAKTDGTCVNWNLGKPSSNSALNLYRSKASGAPAATSQSSLQDGIATGSLSLTGDKVSVKLNYPNSTSFNESYTLGVAGTDGGACWT